MIDVIFNLIVAFLRSDYIETVIFIFYSILEDTYRNRDRYIFEGLWNEASRNGKRQVSPATAAIQYASAE